MLKVLLICLLSLVLLFVCFIYKYIVPIRLITQLAECYMFNSFVKKCTHYRKQNTSNVSISKYSLPMNLSILFKTRQRNTLKMVNNGRITA